MTTTLCYKCCKKLVDALGHPSFPLQVNEFSEVCLILDSGRGMQVLRFCPYCGHELEGSTRGDAFVTVDPCELQDISVRLERLRDANDIRDVLGVADLTNDYSEGVEHSFVNLYKTINVFIRVRSDGWLFTHYSAKPKVGQSQG